jgi:hypothetical protein
MCAIIMLKKLSWRYKFYTLRRNIKKHWCSGWQFKKLDDWRSFKKAYRVTSFKKKLEVSSWSRGEKWRWPPEKILDFRWTSGAGAIYKIKKDSITIFNKNH